METANRRLIRPSLNDHKGQKEGQKEKTNGVRSLKKVAPPDQTHAENFYYVKQMQTKTPMVIILNDGEELHGIIEWYDKGCLKVNREEGANLLIYKTSIKYLYKADQD